MYITHFLAYDVTRPVLAFLIISVFTYEYTYVLMDQFMNIYIPLPEIRKLKEVEPSRSQDFFNVTVKETLSRYFYLYSKMLRVDPYVTQGPISFFSFQIIWYIMKHSMMGIDESISKFKDSTECSSEEIREALNWFVKNSKKVISIHPCLLQVMVVIEDQMNRDQADLSNIGDGE